MAWHHIIPKHEWLLRFGNLDGFNAPDNLIDLYTEQHGQVHLHYFNEITHIEYDRIAGLAILKQIGQEEANILAVKEAQIGRIRTDEWRKGQSIRSKNRRHTQEENHKHSQFMLGKQYALGSIRNDKFKKNLSILLKGIPQGPQPKLTCLHCSKVGGRSLMKRYHMDKCRKKINVAA